MVGHSSKTTVSVPSPKYLFLSVYLFVLVFLPVYSQATCEAPSAALGICRLTAMENAVLHYRQISDQGGWTRVPAGPTLREGGRNERVSFLRRRLVESSDLAAEEDQGETFDGTLKEAVERFQKRHGLVIDGLVGIRTLGELNVPVSQRIQQLASSMEYCRLQPPFTDHRYILVNIPDFTLTLFEDGKPLLTMPVIVGRRDRQTPTMSGRISALVLNPFWNVPHIIATEDMLPEIKKNPRYLEEFHLRVSLDWNSKEDFDPFTIDWAGLSPNNFPYRLTQDPGPTNFLGRVKFVFYPNPEDIYLHDTPARSLFQKESRTFSSGCIRLSKPLKLAAYLLQGTPLGSPEALAEAISGKKTREVAVPSPIVIYIAYVTAWVDAEGTINFRPNIYSIGNREM